MFTLKLYRSGSPLPGGRVVIIETVGIWVDQCDRGVKHVRAFLKTVGVMDERGTPEFYVGGNPMDPPGDRPGSPPRSDIFKTDDDYYDWGVLENAAGKTTEMLR